MSQARIRNSLCALCIYIVLYAVCVQPSPLPNDQQITYDNSESNQMQKQWDGCEGSCAYDKLHYCAVDNSGDGFCLRCEDICIFSYKACNATCPLSVADFYPHTTMRLLPTSTSPQKTTPNSTKHKTSAAASTLTHRQESTKPLSTTSMTGSEQPVMQHSPAGGITAAIAILASILGLVVVAGLYVLYKQYHQSNKNSDLEQQEIQMQEHEELANNPEPPPIQRQAADGNRDEHQYESIPPAPMQPPVNCSQEHDDPPYVAKSTAV